ncbi:MAG: acetylxylan esterase [Reichenbachiella sp.]
MKKGILLLLHFSIVFFVTAQNYPYRSDLLWVTRPDHTDWLYDLNEEASVDLSIYEYGVLLENVEVEYSVGADMFPSDFRKVIKLKDGKVKISLGTMTTPGFKDCRFKIIRNGKEYKHHIKVGFAPDKLQPYTELPPDFSTFWSESMMEAEECPLKVTKTFVPKFSNEKLDCYLVKLQTVKKGNFVYGYLTLPKKSGKYPVVFAPPGAGIKPVTPTKHLFYAENEMIRFDMEIHGIRPDLDSETYREISKAFGNKNDSYLVNGLDNRDSYYMKKVFLSCIRAIDYLSTLEQWDGENMIAQGGSQGGALALITAGLDKRITACAANHPALSDMAGYKANRAGGYPHFFTKFDGMDTPEKIKTMAYFDVVNFARLIKVPVFMTWGFNDNVCPPTTSYIVYNTLNTQKEALITPVNGHWVSTETRYVILNWIKEQLN